MENIKMTKEIKLTQGKFALVDDSDYDYLNQWKWYYSHGYAVRQYGWPIKKTVFMHRLIMGDPPGLQIDHKDNEKPDHGLDNQSSNLRVCTNSGNSKNRGKSSNNTSGYKGVSWDKQKNKWVAQITFDGQHRVIGFFTTAESAAHAYDTAAKKYHGEFSQTNFQEIYSEFDNLANKAGKFRNTKYLGVSWEKSKNKWSADIWFNKKTVHLGSFSNPEDAARAYDKAAKKYRGELAKLNFKEN
jgi:hypothetical protein